MFRPGEVWPDTTGNPIQAHGGGILWDRGTYYWFGENKDADTVRSAVVEFQLSAPIGVSCYASTDLYTWRYAGIALSASAVQAQDGTALHVIERPKVLFNARTGRYVMWFHADHASYEFARVGVAVSDTPIGPYQYQGSFRPAGSDSRDMTLFQDDDGSAYVIFSSEWNQTLWIARLTDDYLSTTEDVTRHLIGQHREAPAVFKHNGRYYMITSDCTGWDPNVAQYTTAPAIHGPWVSHGNPCRGSEAGTTFQAQSTFVLALPHQPGAFIFMADRWNKHDLRDSRYVWLPIGLADDVSSDVLSIDWYEHWDLSVFER